MTPEILYLDLELFVLTARSGPPLEPRTRVVAIGPPMRRILPEPKVKPEPSEQP